MLNLFTNDEVQNWLNWKFYRQTDGVVIIILILRNTDFTSSCTGRCNSSEHSPLSSKLLLVGVQGEEELGRRISQTWDVHKMTKKTLIALLKVSTLKSKTCQRKRRRWIIRFNLLRHFLNLNWTEWLSREFEMFDYIHLPSLISLLKRSRYEWISKDNS